MKVFNKYIISLSLIALMAFNACRDKSDLTEPGLPSTGNVSFTHFVTLGNSITAGYQSGSLFESAQEYAYGNQIAKLVGATYVQQLFSDPGTTGRMEFGGFTSTGITINYNTSSGLPLNTSYTSAFNNLGIPGAILYDIIDETDFATKSTARSNALFSAILRSSTLGKSMLKQALAQSPTLITLWIGNNDVLGYAASGGTSGTDAATGKLPTDVPTFTYLYSQIATQLAASGAKVVLGTLPSISAIPYFNTIFPTLKAAYPTATLYGVTKSGVRALVYGKDLLLLTSSAVLLTSGGVPTGVGLSPSNPLGDKYILDEDEVTIVNTAVTSFNNVITSLATANGFALADFNALFNEFAVKDASGAYVGKYVDGVKFTPSYVTGGLFSLDGVHPTSQGQAIIANKFIDVINAKWGSGIPNINVSTIPGSLIIGNQLLLMKNGIPIYEKGAFDNVLF
jgi:lysophospholipase L1-like esterase